MLCVWHGEEKVGGSMSGGQSSLTRMPEATGGCQFVVRVTGPRR